MAFLLRTVSHSAEGREIVRTRRVEGDRLTVGRDPNCDVHLTDLAVALRHAAIERAAGRLIVTVEPGLSVELNGRKVSTGAIELATGGDILIASHALRFMPTPAGSDEVAVAVERTGEGEAKLDKSAERLFTLGPVLPGKRVLAWLFALLVLGICLGWPIKAYYDRQQRAETFARFHADTLWSSGSLSKAHSGLKDDCTACHVKPFEAVRDSACKTCHTAVHDHADPFRLARARPDLGRWHGSSWPSRKGSIFRRAAASNAIPSMRARSACRSPRSVSAPIVTATSGGSSPTPASPMRATSAAHIPSSSPS